MESETEWLDRASIKSCVDKGLVEKQKAQKHEGDFFVQDAVHAADEVGNSGGPVPFVYEGTH